MARTKPTEAREKVFRAEQTRRQDLERHDPEFQLALRALEVSAKRLSVPPLIPASELTEENWRLPPSVEEQFQEWSGAAKTFFDRWGFEPILTENNEVKLFIHMPLSWKTSVETGETVEVTRKYKYHSTGAVDALEKYYRQIRKRVRTEKGRPLPLRKATLNLQIKAKISTHRKQGLNDQQILNHVDPPSKNRWRPRTDPRYSDVYKKHARRLNLDRAKIAAERELRKLHRAEEAESRKIRDKLRYLISHT